MIKERIIEIEKSISQELRKLSDYIYDNPELGFEEVKSAQVHVDLLKKYGFEVEEGFHNMPTAFKATFNSKKEGPVICYMSEYDALPDVGHGCGHNIFGASSTGAGIVLSKLIDETGGKVIVLGTPAEETSGAKVNFAEDGVFQGMDVGIMAHPDKEYKDSTSSLALMPIQFEFFGKAAHAAGEPEKGINALDAAILTFTNVNALREHIRSDSRVHGVILEGGKAANVVPEYSKAQFYVRSTTKKYNKELEEKIINCAKAGALATGCKLEISQYELAYDDLVTNQSLNKAFVETIREYTNDKIIEGENSGGSLDAGNVSHVMPTIHGYFPITTDKDIAGHTREFAACTKTDYAYEKLDEIVAILANTGYKVLTDKELLSSIKKEFEDGIKNGKLIPPKKR